MMVALIQKPENEEEINNAISIPSGDLRIKDGRAIKVVEWHPHVIADDAVTVTVEGYLCRGPDDAPETYSPNVNNKQWGEFPYTYKCPVCGESITEGNEHESWHILRGNRRGHEHTGDDGDNYIAIAEMWLGGE